MFLVIVLLSIILLNSCQSYDTSTEGLGGHLRNYCSVTKQIAKSHKDCSCNIIFRDYMHQFTYTKINSVYYQIGPPCSQNVLSISYVNSVHDHNEQDFTFNLYLPLMKDEDFFKPDTFHVDTILITEPYPYGGSAGASWNADITLIWDSITIFQGIYSGSGKFIINKEIPSSFPKYTWPVQEIPFVFCNKQR